MLQWNALRIAMKGESVLDSLRLDLKSDAEAYQFLLTYGFDWYLADHREKLSAFYREAVIFLEETFAIVAPEAIRFLSMEVPLLKLLSQDGIRSEDREVLCAVLRIMHVMIHVKSDLRLRYLSKIRRQTIGRIESHLQRVDGQLYLGFESDKVRLHLFETKDRKVESSVILKLVAKPNAIAEDVADYLGVRVVTETKSELVWTLNYLFRHHLISATNLMGARMRNTVMSFESFEAAVSKLQLPVARTWTPEEHSRVDDYLNSLSEAKKPGGNPENPFSSSNYHSLQLTSRPLIRIPSLRKGKKSEISFFFPLEIQLMDRQSYETVQAGPANHADYKKRQLESAKKRVYRGS